MKITHTDAETIAKASPGMEGGFSGAERRAHPRFVLPTGYTPIAIRTLDSETFDFDGHAYDISEGGVQFEMDQAFETGSTVALRIALPTVAGDIGPGRAVFAFANIVWMDDDDVGPVRMAAVFTSFPRAGDRERLLNQIGSGQYAKAA